VCAVLALAITFGVGATARGQDAARYDRLIEQAIEEYSARRYEEARAFFLQAHREIPNPRTLRGIGMSSYELRDYAEAYRALSQALAAPPGDRPLTAAHRRHVQELLDRASALIAIYGGRPERSSVRLDGVETPLEPDGALIVPLGRHEIELTTGDGRSTRTALEVAGGERGPLPLDWAALAASAPRPDPGDHADAGTGAAAPDAGVGANADAGTGAGTGAPAVVPRDPGPPVIPPERLPTPSVIVVPPTTPPPAVVARPRVVAAPPARPTAAIAEGPARPIASPGPPQSRFQLALGSGIGGFQGGPGFYFGVPITLDGLLLFRLSDDVHLGGALGLSVATLGESGAPSESGWWTLAQLLLAIDVRVPSTSLRLRGGVGPAIGARASQPIDALGFRQVREPRADFALAIEAGARLFVVDDVLFLGADLRFAIGDHASMALVLSLGVEIT
jgi:hypothetical protein